MHTETFDVIVLGGGAAGLMCAIEAGKRGRRVAVLERANRIGKKILVSGGGRCNFTNLHCRPDNFLSANPHFCKSALARYTPADFIALVEKHRIPYHEKTLGQLFCDRAAQDVVAMLTEECDAAGVRIITNVCVQEVQRASDFVVRSDIAEFHAPALVVATGGLSIPKIGATSFGYDLARQFGIGIRECRPALVPLTFTADDRQRYCDLAGVSTEVVASFGRQQFREKMLITHRGLSGPAILQVSSYWDGRQPIVMDLAPGRQITAALRDSPRPRPCRRQVCATRAMPIRLAERWLELNPPPAMDQRGSGSDGAPPPSLGSAPGATEGYEKAEVTAGGVDTDELSAKTMESRKVPGLYFIGEVVDVTGHLGGFNFQWAWASGYCAGQAV